MSECTTFAYGAKLEYTENKVKGLIEAWLTPLYLRNWQKIDCEYHYERKESSPDCAADTAVRWEYLTAHINFYLPAMLEMKHDQTEYIVVHELCHLLVNQMRDMCDCDKFDIKYEEFVVTRLAMAMICVRDMTPSTPK